MTRLPLHSFRVNDDLWDAAMARARNDGDALGAVLTRYLESYASHTPPDGAQEYHGLRERAEARPGGKQAMADAQARREVQVAAHRASQPQIQPVPAQCPSVARYGTHSYDDQTGTCGSCGLDMTQ